MENKGFWKVLGKIAIIVGILGFFGINEFSQFLPFRLIPDNHNPTPQVILDEEVPSFKFEKITLNYIKPIKEFFYNGSNNMVCYYFETPTNKTAENFTLIGEWFIHNNIDVYQKPYKENLDYKEILEGVRFNWAFINSESKEKDTVRFRVALKQDVNSISNETTYSLKFDGDLLPYLRDDKEGIINWENNIIREFVNQAKICSSKNEETLVRKILDFTRKKMNRPAETSQINFYNQEIIDSKTSWANEVGTSSEYSAVFAMLLRVVGIPAKIEFNSFNEDYYYVKYYSSENKWVDIDVYGEYNNFGGCFMVDSIRKDRKLNNICISGLEEYVEFSEIEISKYSEHIRWPKIEGVMKNVYEKSLKSYCIKINVIFYDQNGNEVYIEEDKYLSSKNRGDIESEEESEFELVFIESINFDYLKIKLHSFVDSCK